MSKLAIIGGSGIYDLDLVEVKQKHTVQTPFGHPSGEVLELNFDGHSCLFLPRHGSGHKINPSEINYRANIYALKMLGANTVVSVSAVGSLQEQYAPTHFVLPDQFLDWTKGKRERTFFDNGMVGHVSNAYPVNKDLQSRIADVIGKTDVSFHKGGTYVCIEGPQFSTRTESELFRKFEADIIGMTNVPEAFLAKEAGMAYATIAMVTDYDCWKEEHCTVEEIMKVVKANYSSAQKVITKLVPELNQNPIKFERENQYAVITNPDLISEDQKKILEVLQR
ncbi:MAG: S-methyl-5'-thioadenosine phosphorylase [Halobacteriovoraceae bacterium]|nr:S-methyl-5'-thioadenosine phosphorylase [Halobacteriovoraceae bacterium]|tara:strand:+ start:724 stop:1563 length:840 start_codon:yes stop_codon:yes gene_type:complete